MRIKAALSLIYARQQVARRNQKTTRAVESQRKWMHYLIDHGRNTVYGKAQGLDQVLDFETWKEQVPLRDYEQNKEYFESMRLGEPDVL